MSKRAQAWGMAVLALALAAGCSKAPNDAQLVTNVKSQMFSDAQLQGAGPSLDVKCAKGVVTLAGSVPSNAARLEAYKIAAQTPGVTKVNDQMVVEAPAQTAPAQAEPAASPAPVAEARHVREAEKKRELRARARAKHQKTEMAASNPASSGGEMAEHAAPMANPEPAPAPAAAPAAPPEPQPVPVTIPANTPVSVRMIDPVDGATAQAGEIFHASLDQPLVAGNEVVVPRGADVYVRLSNLTKAGRYTGRSSLTLELVKLEYHGRSYALVSTSYTDQGKSRGKGTAEKVGGLAALGAIIGGIAGGGKGAAIGGAVGAGGGGAVQGAKAPKQVTIPSETLINFQLQEPVTITVMPHPSQGP